MLLTDHPILLTVATEAVRVISALIVGVSVRWLLQLSSPQEDYATLARWWWGARWWIHDHLLPHHPLNERDVNTDRLKYLRAKYQAGGFSGDALP